MTAKNALRASLLLHLALYYGVNFMTAKKNRKEWIDPQFGLVKHLSPADESILLAVRRLNQTHDRATYYNEILELINRSREHVGWRSMGKSTLYPTAMKLLEDGLLTTQWGPPPNERLRMFRITDLGDSSLEALKAFREKLLHPAEELVK
jgi:DNA-binding PadR family transcriptional regulator